MSKAVEVTDATFESEVLKSDMPVLADFWAEWCNPCKMIAPLIDKVAADYEGKLKVVKIDVDASNQTASSLGIRSIPTLMIFKGGQAVDQVIGVVAETQLKQVVDKTLGG